MADTIFARYGGFAKVSRVVSSFYDRVLDSPELVGYFDGVDMRRLVEHQTKFIAFLMGGPASVTSEHLARVHEPLDITEESFDEMVALLRETLEDFGFEETDVSTIHSKLSSYRGVVIARPTAAVEVQP